MPPAKRKEMSSSSSAASSSSSVLPSIPSRSDFSSLNDYLSSAVDFVVSLSNGHDDALDVLSSLSRLSTLAKERLRLQRFLLSDPFKVFEDSGDVRLKALADLLHVRSVERVETVEGLTTVKAVLDFKGGKEKKAAVTAKKRREGDKAEEEEGAQAFFSLHFEYKRKPFDFRKGRAPAATMVRGGNAPASSESESESDADSESMDPDMLLPSVSSLGHGTLVTYSVSLSEGYERPVPLLNVEVRAMRDRPSKKPKMADQGDGPKDEEGEEEDDEDDDEDDDEGARTNPPAARRSSSRVGASASATSDDDDADDDDDASSSSDSPVCMSRLPQSVDDEYSAYVFPSGLSSFVSCLSSVGGVTLDAEPMYVLLLLTLQFYDTEWEIHRFVLDCCFGEDGEDGEEDDEDEWEDVDEEEEEANGDEQEDGESEEDEDGEEGGGRRGFDLVD